MPEWLAKLLGVDRVNLQDGVTTLSWQNIPPAWLLVLVIIPAVFLLAWMIYRIERKDVPAKAKTVLFVLRGIIILLVLLAIFGPVLSVEKAFSKKSYIVVLVDESMSMSIPDRVVDKNHLLKLSQVTGISSEKKLTAEEEEHLKRMTRMDIVNRVISNPSINLIQRMNERLNVQFYTFSTTIRSGTEPGKTEPSGNLTAIGDSLLSALNALRNQYIAAVVIFSDGRNNYGRDPEEVARVLGSRHIPIYTVCPGVPQPHRDIELSNLEAPDAVLANDSTNIDFKVKNSGFDGEQITIALTEANITSQTKELSKDPVEIERRIATGRKVFEYNTTVVKGGRENQQERITYKPTEPGEYELIVSTPEKEGEVTKTNNYLTHRIKVADDKIRVLYVDNVPRWEYKHLRPALVRDTTMEVQCILLSADYDFPQEGTPGLEPLTEFPGAMEDLIKYDVLIIGDINPLGLASRKIDADTTLKNIENFVYEFGGGIVFIAGERENPKSFHGTTFSTLLPITVSEDSKHDQESISDLSLRYILTEDGKHHPITTLLPEPSTNTEFWEDRDGRGDGLLSVRWLTKAKRVKPGAIPLVEIAPIGGSEKSPLFVIQPYGRGRIFFSATDDTWYWRKGSGDAIHYTFWRQAIAWARQGKLLGARRFRINVDKDRYSIGETVNIFCNAYTKSYEPMTERELDVYIEPPEGERIIVKLSADRNKQGAYNGSFAPRLTGHYKIWAGELDDEKGRAYNKFEVIVPNREFDNPILDVNTLQSIGEESVNRNKDIKTFYLITDVAELPDKIKPSDLILTETKEDDIWDSPLLYILFALFITSEWVLRKVNMML